MWNIIIWWVSRSGKTTLSSSLADKGFKIYSWDDIRNDFFNSLSLEDKKRLMPILYYLREHNWWDIEISTFEQIIKEKWIDAYLSMEFQANQYIFSEIISSLLVDWENIVVEWVQNTPRSVYDFLNQVDNPSDYKTVFMVRKCFKSIINSLDVDPWTFVWRNSQVVADWILRYSDIVSEKASKFWFEVIDIHTDSNERLNEIFDLKTITGLDNS